MYRWSYPLRFIVPSTIPHYKTSDTYFAAYLRVAGVPFEGTELEGSRVWFLFEKGISLHSLKDEYYNGNAKVCAFDYAKALKYMQSLVKKTLRP